MEFDLSAYAPFQAEVEAWCRSQHQNGFFPPHRAGRSRAEATAEKRRVQRELGERGWLCGGWPVEFGGGGWSKVKQAVFNEVAAYRGIPGTGRDNVGVSTVGPTLMIYGSPAQQVEFLPRIARGEIIWSQGYSEPNAGSDLAALETRAVAAGDFFLITGTKVWNHSQDVDYIFLLARTDPAAPKHRGITQFILPRHTPGVTVRPILDAYGDERWTLLILEEVRLPRTLVVGEVNRGWYQAATSLDFERSQMAYVGAARRTLETLIQLARTHQRGGQPLAADPVVRARLGELAVQLEGARWLSYRVAFLQDQGQVGTPEFSRAASLSKVWACETQQRLQRLGVELVGPLGLLSAGSPWAVLDGWLDEEYWGAPGTTLAGGTSEIQRNIIAQRGFGLPRA
ncbi:MAG: acyl-CoA dehydrogenase family protein [Chloroflexi bacterium]|nr:acyl-CoA dehydrogenase family protein [Chloroflexota bacterium]